MIPLSIIENCIWGNLPLPCVDDKNMAAIIKGNNCIHEFEIAVHINIDSRETVLVHRGEREKFQKGKAAIKF